MAVLLFHGEPGSYKTSTAVQDKLIPGLKEGRIVVSNIEGLYPLEVIEERLSIKFPDSARLFRISTQKEKGLHLIQRWFHWLPPTALLIIDEVQDVFPEGRSFKPDDYNYKNVREYQDTLPKELYDLHIDLLDSFKPDDLDESHTDDLGEFIFDDNNHIIYPKTLSESYMRHRKYNWDIVFLTPDIKKVHSDIRGVTEKAYAHRSKDNIPLPYFQRRPRVLEHPAKENGLVPKKGDPVTFPKINLEVFSVYKSTATGKNNKSGNTKNPIGIKLILYFIGAIACALYFVFGFLLSSDEKEEVAPVTVQDNQVDDRPVIQTNKITNQTTIQNPQADPDSSKKHIKKVSIVSGSGTIDTTTYQVTNGIVELPYKATDFYLSGFTQLHNEHSTTYEHVFQFSMPRSNNQYYIKTESLRSMGYDIIHNSECHVELVKDLVKQSIYCAPVAHSNDERTSETERVSEEGESSNGFSI